MLWGFSPTKTKVRFAMFVTRNGIFVTVNNLTKYNINEKANTKENN